MGSDQVQMWRDMFLGFIVTLSLALLSISALLRIQYKVWEQLKLQFGPLRYVLSHPQRVPSMNYWDPLREALAAGILERGTRDH